MVCHFTYPLESTSCTNYLIIYLESQFGMCNGNQTEYDKFLGRVRNQ